MYNLAPVNGSKVFKINISFQSSLKLVKNCIPKKHFVKPPLKISKNLRKIELNNSVLFLMQFQKLITHTSLTNITDNN